LICRGVGKENVQCAIGNIQKVIDEEERAHRRDGKGNRPGRNRAERPVGARDDVGKRVLRRNARGGSRVLSTVGEKRKFR